MVPELQFEPNHITSGRCGQFLFAISILVASVVMNFVALLLQRDRFGAFADD